MSSPPKQILVVSLSGTGTNSIDPSGEKMVMPPLTTVATHTRPSASTARLSSIWKPGNVQITRPASQGSSGWASTPGSAMRSEEHTSELQSLLRISYAVFCLKKKNHHRKYNDDRTQDQHREK